jgi:hypothetical protein
MSEATSIMSNLNFIEQEVRKSQELQRRVVEMSKDAHLLLDDAMTALAAAENYELAAKIKAHLEHFRQKQGGLIP